MREGFLCPEGGPGPTFRYCDELRWCDGICVICGLERGQVLEQSCYPLLERG